MPQLFVCFAESDAQPAIVSRCSAVRTIAIAALREGFRLDQVIPSKAGTVSSKTTFAAIYDISSALLFCASARAACMARISRCGTSPYGAYAGQGAAVVRLLPFWSLSPLGPPRALKRTDIDLFEIVFRRNALVPLLLITNPVLRRIIPWRHSAGDPKQVPGLVRHADCAFEYDRLSDGEAMSVHR